MDKEFYEEMLREWQEIKELAEEGAKSVIYEMAHNCEYDFVKIMQICERLQYINRQIDYAKKTVEEIESDGGNQ